jgi:hypothetical protein
VQVGQHRLLPAGRWHRVAGEGARGRGAVPLPMRGRAGQSGRFQPRRGARPGRSHHRTEPPQDRPNRGAPQAARPRRDGAARLDAWCWRHDSRTGLRPRCVALVPVWRRSHGVEPVSTAQEQEMHSSQLVRFRVCPQPQPRTDHEVEEPCRVALGFRASRDRGEVPPGTCHLLPTPSTKARQWWWPCRPRVSTGVAPGRVHCGTGRLVGPQVAFPPASERQNQPAFRPSGQPSGLSSHASPRP